MQDVNSTIGAVLAEVLALPEADIAGCRDLSTLPGIDSMKMLRVITRIERRLHIELDDRVVFRLHTLEDLQDLVRQCVEEEHPAGGWAP